LGAITIAVKHKEDEMEMGSCGLPRGNGYALCSGDSKCSTVCRAYTSDHFAVATLMSWP